MSYSIKAILHPRIDNNGLQKIQIRIIHNKRKAYASTDFKVQADQFTDGVIVNHPHKVKMNATIRKQMSDIEDRLLSYIHAEDQSEERLKQLVSGRSEIRVKLTDFMEGYIKEVDGKKAAATIQVYRSLMHDLIAYDDKMFFYKIDVKYLHNLEQHFRKDCERNTINKKMKHVTAFLRRGADRGWYDVKNMKGYQVPTYEQKIPEYLTESEMIKLQEIVEVVQDPAIKTSGMYFLLSCYAGYRLSDLKRFNGQFVKDKRIILTTKKNHSIVAIPIHKRLKSIVAYCLSHPLAIAEQNMRYHVKDLVMMAGIKRRITIHTARHSFAMLLMDKGFDLEEVAELLGNTIKSAAIYARVSNKRLEAKIMQRLN